MRNTDIFEKTINGGYDDVKKAITQYPHALSFRDEDNNTLLHVALASLSKNFEFIRFLVQMGAELEVKNIYGETPLLSACKYNPDLQILKYLLAQGADWKIKTIAGPAFLHYLAKYSHDASILEYVCKQYKLDLNEINHAENTPLIFASHYNPHLEVVRFLVENGANIHYKKSDHFQAVHSAASANPNVHILDYLIASGASTAPLKKTKMTLLHLAGDSNPSVDVTKFLIEAMNMEVNLENAFGLTPFFQAVQGNPNDQVLEAMLLHGANPNYVNSRNKSAIDYAKTEVRKEMLSKITVNATARKTTPSKLCKRRSKELNLLKIVCINNENGIERFPCASDHHISYE